MKKELDSLHSNIQEMSEHSRTIDGLNTEIKSITGLLERCQNDLNTLNEEKDKTDKIKQEIAELETKIKETDNKIKIINIHGEGFRLTVDN
mgnify:CR=1 FL=1